MFNLLLCEPYAFQNITSRVKMYVEYSEDYPDFQSFICDKVLEK